jgi:hypothetical protein
MPISPDTLRVGHTYRIENYGEPREFVVKEKLSNEDYVINDRLTKEEMKFSELLAYGKSRDFQLDEVNEDGEFI